MNTTKLLEARKRKGWSQEKLAEEARVSTLSIQRWEHGKCKPQGDNLERLCEALGLTQEEILGIEIEVPAELPLTLPRPGPLQALQNMIKQDLTMHLWSLASQPHRTYQEVYGAMIRILRDYEKMNPKNYHITRREALLRLVSLPLATLGAATFASDESPTPAVSKDILAQCTVSIAACWELRKSTEYSDLALAFDGVSAYLPVLQRIVKDSSEYHQEAAGLATQCLLLKTLLGEHIESLKEATQYAQQALVYSKEAKDLSLQLRALEGLAVIYTYSKHNTLAFQTIEQAVPLLKHIKQKNVPISPHVLALTNGMLACTLVRNGQDGTAYLDQASALLPEKENDRPIYTSYSKNGLLLDTAIVYSYQGESIKAVEALSQIVDPETFALKSPWGETKRIEVIHHMTAASLRAKDKDMAKVIHFWTAGIQAARAIHSEQRFNEALTAYEVMQYLWPDEKRIQDLRDLTEHW